MKKGKWLFILALLAVAAPWHEHGARAEFGDIIINKYSEPAGMRAAVFPHWFHRIRFRCNVCHADLGFEFKAGGNDITMLKIFDGEFCGACHDGEMAWSVENCPLCHTGKPGEKTGVHNGMMELIVPPAPKDAAK